MPSVSLARKNLFQDRRRAGLAIVGVSAAFVLVLVLDGIFAGAMRQVTAYIRSSPADVFVAQRDVTTMHMTASALAPGLVDDVSAVDGVAWAEGLRYTTGTVESDKNSLLTYVLGYDTTTGRGGPRSLAAGRAPTSGEAVLDVVAADELGVGVGDPVTLLGRSFAISGLSTNGTYIANTTAFVTTTDFAAIRGPTYAYILVGTRDGTSPAALRQRIASALPDTTVMTRADFARQEANVVRSMAADVMAIMSTIGFLIALALIGLTLFTATIAKQREFGILKAIGAGRAQLATVVLTQAAWTVAIALGLAIVLAIGIGATLEALTANLAVDIEPSSVARTAVGAAFVAGVAALLPLHRVAKVDPATAFRMP